MKKWIAVLLSGVFILSFASFAAASEAKMAEPRWEALSSLVISAEQSSGTVDYSVRVIARSADRLSLTVRLQKDTGSGWTNVKTWTVDKNANAVSKSGSWPVPQGAEYRIKASVDVYAGGRYIETGEETYDLGYYD